MGSSDVLLGRLEDSEKQLREAKLRLAALPDVAASGHPKPVVNGAPFIPWGAGDIYAVLSIVKNADPNTTRKRLNEAVPMLESLDYPTCRSAIYKTWHHVCDAYPHLAAKDASRAPYFRKTGVDKQDEMISVLRGLFERVKHPVWMETNAIGSAPQNGGLTPESFGISNVREFENDAMRENDAARRVALQSGSPTGSLQEQIFYHEATRQIAMRAIPPNAAAFFRKLREASDSFVRSRLAATSAADHDTYPQTFIHTMLTVHKDAYGPNGTLRGTGPIQFHATNATFGNVPVAGKQGNDKFAKAHLGSRKQRELNEEARRSKQRFAGFPQSADPKKNRPKLSLFASDPEQFIDARRANQIGGMFIDFDMVDTVGDSEHPWLVESPYMSRRATYVGKVLKKDPIARLGAFCFLMSKVTRQACLALLDAGLNVPMNFILAWPFIQVDTLAMMFAEGGSQTARCNYMLTDVTNPEDGIHKMLDWNLTVWLGAANINPVNQIIIPDVAMGGYRSGLSSKYIRPVIDAESGIRFSDPEFDGCIPMDVPVTFTRGSALQEQHNPLPLFGKHDPSMYSGIFPRNKNIFNPSKPHFASWPAYNAFFGFDKINEGARYDASSYLALKENAFIAGTMYLRRTQTWTGETFDLVRGCKGTGHLDHIDPDTENFRGFLDGIIEFKDTYASY
jgi:hypothetical protein